MEFQFCSEGAPVFVDDEARWDISSLHEHKVSTGPISDARTPTSLQEASFTIRGSVPHRTKGESREHERRGEGDPEFDRTCENMDIRPSEINQHREAKVRRRVEYPRIRHCDIDLDHRSPDCSN